MNLVANSFFREKGVCVWRAGAFGRIVVANLLAVPVCVVFEGLGSANGAICVLCYLSRVRLLSGPLQEVMGLRYFSASLTRRTENFIYPAVLYGQKADLGIVYPRVPSICAWSNKTMLGAVVGTIGVVSFQKLFDISCLLAS